MEGRFVALPSRYKAVVEGEGRWAYRIGAFKTPHEHPRVVCGDTEVFVQKGMQVVFCLCFVHCVIVT